MRRRQEITPDEMQEVDASTDYSDCQKVWKMFDGDGRELTNKSGRNIWPHVGHMKNTLRRYSKDVRKNVVFKEFALVETGKTQRYDD